MALPLNVETATVTGTYTEWDGTPCVGAVTFTPSVCRLIADDGTIITGGKTILLDDHGSFTTTLIASEQTAVIPQDWCYEVTEEVSCLGCSRSYTIALPSCDALTEVFRDDMTATAGWESIDRPEHLAVVSDPAAEDGSALGTTSGFTSAASTTSIPYDGTSLYQLTVRIRTDQLSTSGEAVAYAGFAGVAADGTTLINAIGEDSYSRQHYVALDAHNIDESSDYQTFTGYARGWAAAGDPGEHHYEGTPAAMHTGVAFVRPLFYLLYQDEDGAQAIDSVQVMKTDASGCVLDLSDVLNNS